jgi:hypothetical protein
MRCSWLTTYSECLALQMHLYCSPVWDCMACMSTQSPPEVMFHTRSSHGTSNQWLISLARVMLLITCTWAACICVSFRMVTNSLCQRLKEASVNLGNTLPPYQIKGHLRQTVSTA